MRCGASRLRIFPPLCELAYFTERVLGGIIQNIISHPVVATGVLVLNLQLSVVINKGLRTKDKTLRTDVDEKNAAHKPIKFIQFFQIPI